MNVLEKILEEIEHEAMTNKEIGRKQCEGMARAMNIIRSYIKEFSNGKTNENCMDDELKNKIKDMKEADGFVSISDLVDRFVDVDEYYHHEPWNIRQIVANIDILIPVKKEDLICDNWIPVEERLPNQNGVYNVTRLIDDAFISDSAYFDGQDTWHNDNRVNHARPYLTDIVAWQPLPKQYKPKKTIPVAGMDHIMSRFTKVE